MQLHFENWRKRSHIATSSSLVVPRVGEVVWITDHISGEESTFRVMQVAYSMPNQDMGTTAAALNVYVYLSAVD
ncbi:MAG TPA: hypothetical protein VND94_00910 [Terriglobia bacterium]|nr:hypothetical protein [Terriglobia bacterium]